MQWAMIILVIIIIIVVTPFLPIHTNYKNDCMITKPIIVVVKLLFIDIVVCNRSLLSHHLQRQR